MMDRMTSAITNRVACKALHPMIRRSIAANQPHLSHYVAINGPAYDAHPRIDPNSDDMWGCANALEYGVCLATEDNRRATGWAIPCDMDGTHGDYIGAQGAKDAADLMAWFNVRAYDAITRRSILY